mmetsp:Transcript_31475/g.67996  ORF Transcript_31475/g.67996 Transcript_31475/m.67996 type:complete len:750 (-) Transcript_31475:81-2330(-)
MASVPYDKEAILKSLREKIRRAAAKGIAEEDVWSKHDIPSIPAERVVRHRYNPETRQFTKDETIVKIEKKPFTHGAMRHCFRMKKLATPPQSATNHRFHSYGWSRASNYVAKCYMRRGKIDTSQNGIDAVLSDVILQYEAMHWATKFNTTNAPKKIDFIRAYAMEFVDRPKKPMFAVERFVDGTDSYGNGFLKHNTNAGFVDLEEQRKTPQIFSAYSFYASEGTRLVADVQGVGDLYTDPQVLSIDYRFGDGDLGPRGMALFFKTFRHCDLSDGLGIPIFPLSRNEKKHQTKYTDEESTLSEDASAVLEEELRCRFRALDVNRQRRQSLLMRPIDIESDHSVGTAKRSNISDMSKVIRKSMKMPPPAVIHRTKADVDEISSSLAMGLTDTVFDHRAFHRYESGDLKPRNVKAPEESESDDRRTRGMRKTVFDKSMMKVVAAPMSITEETKSNLGKVHYHLALLHGMDRFPEIVQSHGENAEDAPSHDIFSVIFHLCHAASLYNVSACLSLARARVGLDTFVSPLLKTNVPIDFESSKEFCKRAMASKHSIAAPKVAAGCLLYQIIEDEGTAGDVEKIQILEETLSLMKLIVEEDKMMKEHAEKESRGKAAGFHVGDKAEGNYFMEGTFYPGVIVDVAEDGNSVVIQYDDDQSQETLTNENVRSLEPPPEILAALTHRLSDEEALGTVNTDEQCLFEDYDLMAKLAELKEKTGERSDAATLFQEAAELAMNAGKMTTANKWSMRAASLEG